MSLRAHVFSSSRPSSVHILKGETAESDTRPQSLPSPPSGRKKETTGWSPNRRQGTQRCRVAAETHMCCLITKQNLQVCVQMFPYLRLTIESSSPSQSDWSIRRKTSSLSIKPLVSQTPAALRRKKREEFPSKV